MVVYAVVMMCVWPLGVPLIFTVLLWRQRRILNPEGKMTVEEAEAARSKSMQVAHTSFLWAAYECRCYWFEVRHHDSMFAVLRRADLMWCGP
jgi:hypothetical protein